MLFFPLQLLVSSNFFILRFQFFCLFILVSRSDAYSYFFWSWDFNFFVFFIRVPRSDIHWSIIIVFVCLGDWQKTTPCSNQKRSRMLRVAPCQVFGWVQEIPRKSLVETPHNTAHWKRWLSTETLWGKSALWTNIFKMHQPAPWKRRSQSSLFSFKCVPFFLSSKYATCPGLF